MAFDLNAAKAVSDREEQGTLVKVFQEPGVLAMYTDENGNERPAWIRMAGKHSHRYRRKEAQQRARRLKADSLVEGKFHSDTEELAAACAIEWAGVVGDGAATKCTEHNVVQFFRASSWNYDECVEAMNTPALFSPSSSPAQ
jgi:hypothetical protein